jgi:ABC-type sugar transport system ATPase subunit
VCDRIAVMRRGELLDAVPADEASEESLMARAVV